MTRCDNRGTKTMNANFKNLVIAKKAFSMVTRNETKNVDFASLTKDEKLAYYEATQEIPETLSDVRLIKACNLTKDLKIELIAKAAQTGNLEQVTAIATNSETEIPVNVSVSYDKASTKAKLSYFSKIDTPNEIELPVLGGRNLLEFAQYIVNNWASLYNETNDETTNEDETGDD